MGDGFLSGRMDDFGREALLDEHAQTVTYTTKAGATTDIQAVFVEGPGVRDFERDGEYYNRTATVMFATNATQGIAAPFKSATITVGSEVWAVEGVSDRDDQLETITWNLTKPERDELSAAKFRS